MPIYEYACQACGHAFEEWQKMSDPPVKVCPKCKKKKVEKLISQTAFQLKGGGWYKDLYSSSKPGAAASDGGGSSDGGTKGAEKSGDSSSSPAKAETKSDAKSDAKGAKKKDTPKKPETRAA